MKVIEIRMDGPKIKFKTDMNTERTCVSKLEQTCFIRWAYNQFKKIKTSIDVIRNNYKRWTQAIVFRMSQLSTTEDFLPLKMSEAAEAEAAQDCTERPSGPLVETSVCLCGKGTCTRTFVLTFVTFKSMLYIPTSTI